MKAKELLALTNLIKHDRADAKRSQKTSEQGLFLGQYQGFDATTQKGFIKLAKTGETVSARVITNGTIVPGTRVIVKVAGSASFVDEMPR
ncbi:MAG: hypothetical protein ACRC62_12370 [Microcoleus sp.]